jgi:hypothetical protein
MVLPSPIFHITLIWAAWAAQRIPFQRGEAATFEQDNIFGLSFKYFGSMILDNGHQISLNLLYFLYVKQTLIACLENNSLKF